MLFTRYRDASVTGLALVGINAPKHPPKIPAHAKLLACYEPPEFYYSRFYLTYLDHIITPTSTPSETRHFQYRPVHEREQASAAAAGVPTPISSTPPSNGLVAGWQEGMYEVIHYAVNRTIVARDNGVTYVRFLNTYLPFRPHHGLAAFPPSTSLRFCNLFPNLDPVLRFVARAVLWLEKARERCWAVVWSLDRARPQARITIKCVVVASQPLKC